MGGLRAPYVYLYICTCENDFSVKRERFVRMSRDVCCSRLMYDLLPERVSKARVGLKCKKAYGRSLCVRIYTFVYIGVRCVLEKCARPELQRASESDCDDTGLYLPRRCSRVKMH